MNCHGRALAPLLVLGLTLSACTSGRAAPPSAESPLTAVTPSPHAARLLPGMPPPLDPNDVYAADRAGALDPRVARVPERVYVPNSEDNTVDVIDPHTFRIVKHYAVGALPQHVTPSYDLRTLWIDESNANRLSAIDPRTGRLTGRRVHVGAPYNLYFTPDGTSAIVVSERLRRLEFRDARTLKLTSTLRVPCAGVDHLDYTADGRFFLASCEFSGSMLVVDVVARRVVRTILLRRGAMPQDVKLSPDGRTFYVADMMSNGVWTIDGSATRKLGFLPTGAGAHGLYVSRDSQTLYISNRGESTISLLSFASGRLTAKWRIPGGGSPDMGGVSADGTVLWLSGRYDGEVYAIDTSTGRLRARIKVGRGPHGLCVYPQPGRYSLGHTGVFR